MIMFPSNGHMATLDGTLEDWADLEDDFSEAALLLGNGLSINVWRNFSYRALYDFAQDGALTEEEVLLFDGSPNFERALADLNTARRVCQVLGMPTDRVLERYQSVQAALGDAVRAVHVGRYDVPTATLQAIREELVRYEWVFTTSYDLILYWSMACGGFTPFIDHFRGGGRLTFDASRAEVYEGQVPVYFLHGALHLVVGGDGTTWKTRSGLMRNLLEQFGAPIAGDPEARPLLVTEGSARDKLRAIEGNVYLSHALDRLAACDLPMVVFGSSLSAQDDHLIGALNQFEDRPLAVSLLPGPKRDLARQQADIFGRVDADELRFFDATTHPLGDPALRVQP